MPVNLGPYSNWITASFSGLWLGFAAIIGDLAEVIVKRSAGVKDSGSLSARHRRFAGPDRQPAFHRAAAVFLPALYRAAMS